MTLALTAPTIAVVGGTYRERCLRPAWAEVFGSAGRAASAMTQAGAKVQLFTYVDEPAESVLSARCALDGTTLAPSRVDIGVGFSYDHGLATPRIDGVPAAAYPPIEVRTDRGLRFGMLEGDAIVHAEQAVYDPQSAARPVHFHANGSSAKRLAVVLNRHEAALLAGDNGLSVDELARAIKRSSNAEVVVIKQGARGAFVLDEQGIAHVPAFQSQSVWKIGSGDVFAAYFAHAWLELGLGAAESAERASKATAFFCETQGFPDSEALNQYKASPIRPSARFVAGYRPKVYLAGPFFNLAQVWLVDQAREDLCAAGLEVFSPYHDVGHGSAEDVVPKDIEALKQTDIVLALADGMDPGTVFEIGYARSCGKPVVVYCERELPADLKMMQGTYCLLEQDYVTAIYRTVWCACVL